jgi:hypothetical protein
VVWQQPQGLGLAYLPLGLPTLADDLLNNTQEIRTVHAVREPMLTPFLWPFQELHSNSCPGGRRGLQVCPPRFRRKNS